MNTRFSFGGVKTNLLLAALLLQCLISTAQTYTVGVQSLTWTDASRSNRSVPVEFHYPGTNSAITTGAFGFVVFGHGFDMTIDAYYNYADSLASHGYIVALTSNEGGLSPTHANLAQDLVYIYNKMISESNTNSSSPLYHHVKPKGSIAGHSMGGGCTVLSTQYSDTATCYWTLAEATTNPSSITAAPLMRKPYLSFAGGNDCIAPPSTNQIPTYDTAGSVCKTYIQIANATHCQFAISNVACNFGEGVSGCASTPLSRSAQTNAVLNFLYPYLDYYLNGNCAAWTLFESRYNADAGDVKMQTCNNVIPTAQSITGNSSFCTGSSDTLTAHPSGFLYTWSNNSTASSINVTAGGSYTLTVSNGTCSVTAAPFTVTQNSAPATPSAITSVDSVCSGSNGIALSVVNDPTATGYTWSVPNGWSITGGNNTNAITASAGNAGGTISVTAQNSCGSSAASQKTITVSAGTLGTTGNITGDTTPCAGQTVHFSIPPVSGASSYAWTYPSGWTPASGTSADSINLVAGSQAGTITVQAINTCGRSSAATIHVTSAPFTTTQTITGNAAVCQGAHDTLTATPAGYTYLWSNNATTASISVSAAGTYTVTITNGACSVSTTPFTVSLSLPPNTPSAITANDTVCGGISNISVSVTNDPAITSYNWTLPAGWNISAGNNTNAITAVSGNSGGTISVTAQNACGVSSASQKTVVVVPSNLGTPGSISGLTAVCNGQTIQYNIAPVSGANSYFWTYPAGWSVNGNATNNNITLVSGATAGNISVAPVNGCGQGVASTIAVNIKPAPTAGTITGLDSVCINAGGTVTFTLANASGADSIYWTVPGAWTLVSGQNSNSVTVNPNQNGGSITAGEFNTCGTASSTPFNLSIIDTTPATITQSNDTLTASAGSSYQWYLNGTVINGATGQTYVTQTSGDYKVEVTNAGNCSGTSASLHYTWLSITNINQNVSVNLYPNPTATGQFRLSIGDCLTGGNLAVFDALGRNVMSLKLTSLNTDLDLQAFSKGIYMLRIAKNDNTIQRKLIFE